MDMHALDEQLRQGLISQEGLKQLIDAEIYGTATPMQWLEKRLRAIQEVVASGRQVTVHAQNQRVVLANQAEFEAWCARTLPDAYSCFIKEHK